MTPVSSARGLFAAVPAEWGGTVRRRAEQLAALLALLLVFPLVVVIAGTIAALSRRGPLVSHLRVGWKGVPLKMLKFRTMWRPDEPRGGLFAVEPVSGPVSDRKDPADCRVTSRFAAFCRRYSLDEIPQLYHVVRGEMSFVGPRPVTAREVELHYGDCAEELVSVRPGLTGLWQTSGRNRLSYDERRRLDLILVQTRSRGLYWKILVRTLPVVLRAKGTC